MPAGLRRGRRKRVTWWHRTWRDEAGQEDEPPGKAHGSAPGTAGGPWGQRQGRLTLRGWEVAVFEVSVQQRGP